MFAQHMYRNGVETCYININMNEYEHKMATVLLCLLLALSITTTSNCNQEMAILQMIQTHVSYAKNWTEYSVSLQSIDEDQTNIVALRDCAKLYEESESRLSFMVDNHKSAYYTNQDMLTWVSSVMTNHRTCLDGLQEKGYVGAESTIMGKNLTMLLREALVLYSKNKGNAKGQPQASSSETDADSGLLARWSKSSSKADFIVAQDGSGTHKTIKDALDALAAMDNNRPERAVIYVKSGVYSEKVEVGHKLKNVMLVGDGIDNTVVTGYKNVMDGYTTFSSATFDVSGDGFWGRDITFENTAGAEKQQAVAVKVSSDLSIFYRCSFKAYQDTLYVHSNRQFYRDCDIYGTIDFIFGDSSVNFQNCNILVRKPMDHQSNFITAQGRSDPNQPTGISIQSCMVKAAPDFVDSKDSFKSYLGRPWKEYSRTVFMKTDLDGLIDPKGWGEWNGDFALSTLYYVEFMNTGSGSSTQDRIHWPGFHLMSNADEAMPFTVSQFLQGDQWIPNTGVPFWSAI